MIPPGLAFCTVSPKAWKAAESSKLPKYYFNFKKYKKAYEETDTPFTSAITLVIGLKRAVEMINSKGIDRVIADHKRMARAFRESMKAMGLELFSKSPSSAVTAVNSPEGLDADNVIKLLKTEFGVTFAGGQGDLKGKIFRAAHMGGIDEEHTMESVNALECALTKLGYKFKAGSGVETAKKIMG
jgi:aspartate aminotransferase-like enzyme